MKKIILTLAASIMLATSALAGGFGIGVKGSLMNIEGDVTETTTIGTVAGGTANTNSASVSNDGIISGEIFAEYTFDSLYNITLGVGVTPGSADISNKLKSRTETPGSGNGETVSTTYTAQAEIENLRSLYVELPVYQGVFLKGGLMQMDLNTIEKNVQAYGNSTDINGSTWGVGLRSGTDTGLMYKLAYEVQDFDEITITSVGGNKIKGNIDTKGLALSVGYIF